MKLYDKVRVKSKNIIGFIVHISGGWYAVEKEGNEGPIYWELTAEDLELVESPDDIITTNEFDPTQSVNVDDLDIEEIERKFEMLSPEDVLEMSQNFGSPPPNYEFLPELKRDNFHDAEFVYNGIKYWFAGWWILGWEEKGEEKTLEFDTKEEFLAAPVFNGKTIEEIANEIKYYDICLEPGAYE